ncbi:FAD dependent oxidoreductase [Staphylotrichum tortipilum]|uniref:FAD dependent oxidoreductase n=1 Tax=Staphylotrichum tortipilum TaxID=2831512 RepID=A0AAN6MAG0_9PEZI|nr:FAD dependent oxidoreductase [Staphylotrichum longicolle]
MDERARIPVSAPCANPTASYWQDPPSALADHRSTPDLPAVADTVIVGSGITGAAVAWHLLQEESSGSILMLEARQVCSGATGRNGGHTKHASYRTFPHHSHSHSPSLAIQIARLELASQRALHALAQTHSLPCASHPCPTLDVIYSPAEWASAQSAVAAMREAFEGEEEGGYELFTREEVMETFGVADGVYQGGEEKVRGGVGYQAGSVSGYELTVGVLGLCLEKGMGFNLQTNTVVEAVEKDEGGGWVVKTSRGTVKAKRVVLATNGYTAAVWKAFQGVVVPLRGQVMVQRPGSGLPEGGCLERTYSFIYERGYEYMVTRPAGARGAGDVVIGGGLARAPGEGIMEFGSTGDSTINEGISEYLRECTGRYFGAGWGEDDPAGRVKCEWTGIMGFSPDGFPFVGEVPGEEGLWVSASFQGHGMVLCWESARALVEMMEGRDNEELKEWFPEVFRITRERMAQRFKGRLDALPKEGDE